MRICIDMDETIADAMAEQLTRYNRCRGTSLTKNDFLGKSFYDVLPDDHEAADAYLYEGDFYLNLAVIPDSPEVIATLAKKHDIFIATATMKYPNAFQAKYQWLLRNFPFLNPEQFVFCGNKSILNADFLIDDQPQHFRHFRGEGILFAAPHNHGVNSHRRAESWKDVLELFPS